MKTTEINIVIGSWGSYNACNERALGSKWLSLADFDCWDEIAEELKKQGFRLDGIDEELFIRTSKGFLRTARIGIMSTPKTCLKSSKKAAFWTTAISTIPCSPIWKYVPSANLREKRQKSRRTLGRRHPDLQGLRLGRLRKRSVWMRLLSNG